jgi:ElaB/YqjD/DUF883 family membrane-anchored ribosome-binding protein
MDRQFAQALNEMKAELQELYETLDSELRSTDNQGLIEDSYHGVTSKLETALNEMDNLISDVDNGVYDDNILDIDTDLLEVED